MYTCLCFLTNTKTQTCNGTKKTINGNEKRARVYYVLLLCWNACNTLIYRERLPLFALSSSMFCAFSRWSKTYNISPPRLNSNIGSVCIDFAMFWRGFDHVRKMEVKGSIYPNGSIRYSRVKRCAQVMITGYRTDCWMWSYGRLK